MIIASKQENHTPRVALYIRVSTQEQAKEGYSVGEQTERLRKYAEAHDWIIANVYTDPGFSGANTNRPALQDMLQDIRKHKIDKVLVYKLDRLSRSQKDTLTLIENEFIPNGTDFESMSERLDTSTAQGKLFLGILAAFAQLEREVIKERLSMGINARIKEGKWRGGKAVPFGYDYNPENEKLTINPYEAMIVRFIFEEHLSGKPLYVIMDEMEKKGYTFRSGKLDLRNIRSVLQRKTYCGYQKYHDEWIHGNHEAIISEDMWNKTQEILTERKRRFDESGVNAGTDAVSTNLAGFLYCARCGARYSKYRTGSKLYGFHENYYCYSRSRKVKRLIKDPNCDNKLWRCDDLDTLVFDEIKKLRMDPEYIHNIRKTEQATDTAEQIRTIEGQIKTIESQISRFLDLYGLGHFELDELDSKVTPLRETKQKLQTEVNRLSGETKTMTDTQILKLAESFDDALDHGTLDQRRSIIEQLIQRIDIDGDDITIHWNFN